MYKKITAKTPASAKSIIKGLAEKGRAYTFNFRPVSYRRDGTPCANSHGGVSVVMIPKDGGRYHVGIAVCSIKDRWTNIGIIDNALHRARTIELKSEQNLEPNQIVIDDMNSVTPTTAAFMLAEDAWRRVSKERGWSSIEIKDFTPRCVRRAVGNPAIAQAFTTDATTV